MRPPDDPEIHDCQAMPTAKQEAESVLRRLPDNCTLEDIRCHLYVLEKIGKGRKDIEDGRSFTADEARERLASRLTN